MNYCMIISPTARITAGIIATCHQRPLTWTSPCPSTQLRSGAFSKVSSRNAIPEGSTIAIINSINHQLVRFLPLQSDLACFLQRRCHRFPFLTTTPSLPTTLPLAFFSCFFSLFFWPFDHRHLIFFVVLLPFPLPPTQCFQLQCLLFFFFSSFVFFGSRPPALNIFFLNLSTMLPYQEYAHLTPCRTHTQEILQYTLRAAQQVEFMQK